MKKLFLALAMFSIIGSMTNLHANYQQAKNCYNMRGSWNKKTQTCEFDWYK